MWSLEKMICNDKIWEIWCLNSTCRNLIHIKIISNLQNPQPQTACVLSCLLSSLFHCQVCCFHVVLGFFQNGKYCYENGNFHHGIPLDDLCFQYHLVFRIHPKSHRKLCLTSASGVPNLHNFYLKFVLLGGYGAPLNC